jgi:hypothetical protein
MQGEVDPGVGNQYFGALDRLKLYESLGLFLDDHVLQEQDAREPNAVSKVLARRGRA